MIGNSAGEHHGIKTNSIPCVTKKDQRLLLQRLESISLGDTPVYHGKSQLVGILVLVCVFQSF